MTGVAHSVDLTPIIDRQKIGAFHVKLVIIAFLVVMADGYDPPIYAGGASTTCQQVLRF